MAKKEDKVDFEEAFRQLEEAVQTLEEGGLTLVEATNLYEQGIRLAQFCSKRLDATELKVTELQNAFLKQNESPEDLDE